MEKDDERRKPNNWLVGLALLGFIGVIGLEQWRNRSPDIEKYINVDIDGKNLKVPDYDLKGVPCAQYARLTAKNLFDLKYVPCDAWDHIKRNNVVERVDDFGDLESLSEEGVLKQGMLIGLYNPDSSFNKEGREFTHVGVYLGDGKIAHFYKDSLVENFEELRERGLIPKALIAPKN
tara:strand:+ start:1934 stop:2464 length:531 start_codon:yes stop_codon:yes gene_type:complete